MLSINTSGVDSWAFFAKGEKIPSVVPRMILKGNVLPFTCVNALLIPGFHSSESVKTGWESSFVSVVISNPRNNQLELQVCNISKHVPRSSSVEQSHDFSSSEIFLCLQAWTDQLLKTSPVWFIMFPSWTALGKQAGMLQEIHNIFCTGRTQGK